MNKRQWVVLIIMSYVLMFLFVALDIRHGFIFMKDPCIGSDDVACLIRGEIYAPFIWLSFASAVTLTVLVFLEPILKYSQRIK